MLIAHRGVSSVEEDALILNKCNREVAVEKLPRLKKRCRRRDRKCPPKRTTSFVGHPSATKFLRISRV